MTVEPWIENPLRAAGNPGDAVGFVGVDLPIDVFCSSGRFFGHLPWRCGESTDWADRWLEPSFPRWARSILQQWYDGAFDGFEKVVFSRADDASQRLFYYVRELQRRGRLGGPAVHLFDIALLHRESSVDHTAAAILELVQALHADPARLPAGVERANRLRCRLADLEKGRRSNGPAHGRLARAALWSDPNRWLDTFVVPEQEERAPRVLLSGSFPPDERLHLAIEQAVGTVVAEAHPHGLGRLGCAVELNSERPERALARHLQRTSVGPRAVLNRAEWILERCRRARADVAVIWLTAEDEALAWSAQAQQRALAAAGVPTLLLTGANWDLDSATLESVCDFLRAESR